MANPSGFLLAISLLLLGTTTLITAVSSSASSGLQGLTWFPTSTTNESGSSCRGECMANNMDDDGLEFNRRVLQTSNTQYISYGALQRDTTPCSLRGASYYNCQPGAQANPYDRGCSAIARCRG
ncbi:Rapid alkalinization factor 23 [Hibiscus syriacus]|uniref:Rapid alkalinization factor 23 n=1 Tax=Hibiscus syriacus TaxID=106335 RepID=A0A6A3ABV3_HIBSY|nr:protein RALF-like 1 [Hibiscus syriacus]KAE8702004.1 Rapid alkalinization factor 23 [Hibiscus syriacus]